MKFFAVVLLAVIAVASANVLNLSDEQKERIKGFAAECREKEGVTKEQVQALRAGNFAGVDHKVQCFSNCFLEKVGFIANGVLQPEVIHAKLDPLVGADKVKAAGDKCKALTGADNCETAFKIFECTYHNHVSVL